MTDFILIDFVHALFHIFRTVLSLVKISDVSVVKVTLGMEKYALGT